MRPTLISRHSGAAVLLDGLFPYHRQLCKSQILSALKLRNVDDLARVMPEMLGDAECRIQPGNVIALNFMFSRQRIFREACDHTARIPDGSAQLGDERLPGNGPSLRKFAVAFPLVFRSAEARNNPLADISA